MDSSVRNGGFLVGAAAIVALALALAPKPHGPAEPAKADGEKKPGALEAVPSSGSDLEGPLAPIREFLGLCAEDPARDGVETAQWSQEKRFSVTVPGVGAMQLTEEKRTADEEKKYYLWPKAPHCRFRFLIATVPDPEDSGLAYMFDQVVEALQRALEKEPYVFDHAWLPWRRPAAAKQASRLSHRVHPGLVLFRGRRDKASGTEELLALLLVGETATSGIHKRAFSNAVRVVLGCPPCQRATDDAVQLRVIGPYFSGSAVSLRKALEEARRELREEFCKHSTQPPEPWIKVVSGSASGLDHSAFVTDSWAGAGSEKKAFQTTILPDRVCLKWLLNYLGKPAGPAAGTQPGEAICVMYEANTNFGNYVVEPYLKREPSQTSDQPSTGSTHFFFVPYPLHISQLRSSYTAEQLARLEAQGLPRAGRNLPFPSENADKKDTGHEAIPAQAPLMTAAINDLVLDNLVTTLAQKHGKYICIISTDPQDIIFLARLIRDRFPDVQIATVGSDLLFAHEEYNSALRGTIVASTYPLYPAVQGFSETKTQRAQGVQERALFANQSFEGCYNAALVHLADEKPDSPIAEHFLDYGWEGRSNDDDRTFPPIWISVVGSNGQLVPVTYIRPAEYLEEDPDALDNVFPVSRKPHAAQVGRVRPPSLSILLFFLLLAVNVFFFGRAWNLLRNSSWSHKFDGLCSKFKQCVDFGAICLAQVILYGQIAEWALVPFRFGWRKEPLVGVASLAVFLVSILMASWAYIALWRAHFVEPISGSGTRPARLRRLVERWKRLNVDRQPLLIPWLQQGLQSQSATVQRACLVASRSGLWIVIADAAMLLLVTLVLTYFALRLLSAATTPPPDAQTVINFERQSHLGNGVSSVLPRVLFCAALFVWGYNLVKKLRIASFNAVSAPFPRDLSRRPPTEFAHRFRTLCELDEEVRGELMPPSTLRLHFGKGVIVFAFTAAAAMAMWQGSIPPVDGKLFGDVALLGFGVFAFLLLFTLLQFYSAWRALKKLLHVLALLPMEGAFGRLHEKLVSTFGHYVFSQSPRHSHFAISVQQFHRLQRLFAPFQDAVKGGALGVDAKPHPLGRQLLAGVWEEVEGAFPNKVLEPSIIDAFANEERAAESELATNYGGQTGADCSELATRCLRVLCRLWPAQTLEAAFGQTREPGEPRPVPPYLALPEDDPIRQWAMAAENFAATEIIRYLSQFIAQLRTLLFSLTVGSLLLVLAATVYPFFPQQRLLLGLTLMSGFIAVVIGSFLVQLNKDHLVSRITGSTPNRFTPDWAFVQALGAYVIPILACLMVQFPFVTSSLRSLLDPLIHIVR
jgi:hypothetical protein